MTVRTKPAGAVTVGFVVHVMQVAGAEVLVAETIKRLGARIDPVIFCLDQIGPLGERLAEAGVPVVAFGRRPGLDLAVSWRMAKAMRAHEIDVVHAHQYTPFFYGALAARLVRPRPRVIFTEHGRHYPDVVSPKRRTINRLVFDHLADHVNAVCQFSATSLAEKDGFRAPRIDVIPNGVDVPKYDRPADAGALRRTLGLAVNRRFIATIARFHPVKDHQTLLRAFAIVARARVDVDLLLVGDGALRGDLERLTATLGLTERVRFMGVRGDVADILKAVDVFALTSVSEAASITLLEAMAAETPVVVTAVGGNPEIVRQDVDGLLVPRGDAEAVAGALIRVLDDAAFARSLGASAGKRVRSEFLLDSTVERYFGLYAGSNDRPWAA